MSEAQAQMSGVFVLTNDQSTSLTLVLEPWADETELPVGSSLRVKFSGPADGQIEIKLSDDRLVVYGWHGSILTVMP